MKGEEKPLIKYLQTAVQLIIPVYQRNYDWKEEHCKKLFDDLVKVIKYKKAAHFFGSVVSVSDPMGTSGEYLIIDGQQRITTISLLFLSLANLMREEKLIAQQANLIDRIEKQFLIDQFQPENKKIKLKSIKGDQAAYELLWLEPDEYAHASNITLNYLYFYKRLQLGELVPDEMYTAISKLQIIDISLNPLTDDAQLIFESLNSTGLELSEGDKIRNYILMGLSLSLQGKYYINYWNPVEKKAGYDKLNNSYDVSLFIRDYLSVKQRQIPSMREIYFKFKEYAEPFKQIDLEGLLTDMLEYAKRYQKLLSGDSSFPHMLNTSIYRLNRFESSVTRPFFLEVLRGMDDKVLVPDHVTEVFRIVEAYLFRRTVCDLPSNALNKVFLTLANDIQRLSENEDYVERLKYILTNKKEKARFPDDDEFVEGLTHKNVYAMPPRYRAYLFERLENGDSKEYKDVYARLDSGDYTIEHIMPQKLSAPWYVELGADAEEVHETWLHRLGNLTLTAYNATYSNKSFNEKKEVQKGFVLSGIRLNQEIARNEHWHLQEMQERSTHLANEALSLWPYPLTSYVPVEKLLDEYSLDEGITFTNKLLVKYRFRSIERETNSWAEMYADVLKELHSTDRSILNYLADANDTVELAIHVGRSSEKFSKSAKIDEDIYLWTNTSTQYKVNLLLKFFALYHEEPDNLMLFTKDYVPDKTKLRPQQETRLAYWAAAIPMIKEKTGAFVNSKPTMGNWIAAGTGYKHVSYLCITNKDSVRVELYIGIESEAVNKALFDEIAKNRAEIEAAFGEILKWRRYGDTPSSRVSFTLDQVKYTNNEDWPRMIQFHGDMMKNFQDAMNAPLQAALRQ